MPTTNPYDRAFWIGAAVVIVLLSALFFVPINYALPPNLLGWIAGGIVLFAVLSAQILSWKQGLWKMKQSFTIEVTDGKLIQRRAGSAAVAIPFNEIESVRQGDGWIEVKSGEKQIMIPAEIRGFDDLKTQLEKCRTIIPVKSKALWLSWSLTFLMIAASIEVLTSHQRKVIEISGAMILVGQAWWLFSLGRRLWARPKVAVLLLFYVVSLLLSAWLIFQRINIAS